MSAAVGLDRRIVLGAAVLAYGGVFAGFVLFEHEGLGVGHFFYVPICLVALVTDEIRGGAAGVFAAGLYALGVVVAPGVPAAQALTEATVIRLVTYTLVGGIVGAYARRNRVLLERLRDHAQRDYLTTLANARMFEEELARRCASGAPFTLVLADLDALGEINDAHGHDKGNEALRRVGEALRDVAGHYGLVCRVGGDEFALVTSLRQPEAADLCERVSRALAGDHLQLSFGTTTAPADGTTPDELFRKADDRLFAAKMVSRNRRTVVALA